MKKLNSFILILLCSIACTSILGACSGDDEKPEPTIAIQEICGIYTPEQVKMNVNGDEVPLSGNVSLLLPSSDATNGRTGVSGNEAAVTEKMLLEIPPLWPNILDGYGPSVSNIVFEVDAVTSPEQVAFEGAVGQYNVYELAVKGVYKDGILTLDMIYTTTCSLAGKMYAFDFSKASLDTGMLNPSVKSVEWQGSQVPVEEFVVDAVAPVFEAIGRRLGGTLCMEFLPEGSLYLGVKSNETGNLVPVPGKHGFRNYNNGFCYLMTDAEGALWISKAVNGSSESDSSIFLSIGNSFYFVPVFCLWGNSEDELRVAFDTPVRNRFHHFLFYWLECLGETELSEEEMAKAHKVATLLQEENILYIRLSGIAVK